MWAALGSFDVPWHVVSNKWGCVLLVDRFKLGLAGAALAFMLTQVSSALLLMAYTIWRDAFMAARGGRAVLVWLLLMPQVISAKE